MSGPHDKRRESQPRAVIAEPTQILDASMTRSAAPASGDFAGGDDTPAGQRFEAGVVLAKRFRIEAVAGAGGMGEVYRAFDLQLKQLVALKFLPMELARDPRAEQRLLEEVRLAREVSHPNVCRVYDVVRTEDLLFISMEFIDGEDLHALLNRIGRLAPDKALELAHQLCIGLAAAHARGVLHRDLKPANVMIDSAGRARLTDFGLASRDAVRGSDVRTGTPAYMAPEQILGLDYTVRSDVYALGLVLYELFTGQRAFQARSFEEYRRLHELSSPAPLTQHVPELDPAIERVILHCLEKNPADRPASALAVSAELPGGDPLQAAIAAGETPSPELVAASGETRGLKARVLWLEFVAVAVLIFLNLWVKSRVVPEAVPIAKPPAVLADRAMDVLRILGLDGQVRDSDYGIGPRNLAPFGVTGQRRMQSVNKPRVAAADEVGFWYRAATAPLMAEEAGNLLFGGAQVRINDPPAFDAGTIDILLDESGELQRLTLPGEGSTWSPVLASGLDWNRLQLLSGFDPTRTSERERSSASGEVETRAWEQADDRGFPGNRQFLVQSVSGRLRSIQVLDVKPRSTTVGREALRARWTLTQNYEQLIWLLMSAVAVPLAQFNLSRKRSDPRGATRLAVFVFLAVGAVWLLHAHHVGDVDGELRLLLFAGVGALALATVAWFLYAALEPYLRRYWPQALISWSRVLTGRWRDPLVGRHLLFGVLLGTVFHLLGLLEKLTAGLLGWSNGDVLFDADAFSLLLGARHALAVTLVALLRGIYTGMLFLLVIVLLRAALRRPTAAIVASTVVFMLLYVPRGTHPVTASLFLGVGAIGLGAWAMTRFGLLTIATALFVLNGLASFPATLDPQAWYSEYVAFAAVAVLGVAGIGVWLAREPSRRLNLITTRAYLPSR